MLTPEMIAEAVEKAKHYRNPLLERCSALEGWMYIAESALDRDAVDILRAAIVGQEEEQDD